MIHTTSTHECSVKNPVMRIFIKLLTEPKHFLHLHTTSSCYLSQQAGFIITPLNNNNELFVNLILLKREAPSAWAGWDL